MDYSEVPRGRCIVPLKGVTVEITTPMYLTPKDRKRIAAALEAWLLPKWEPKEKPLFRTPGSSQNGD